MEKKLYYTVHEISGNENWNHKTLTIYKIENNIPIIFFDLELPIEANDKESIQNWLNDNGYEDNNIKLIKLY